MMVPISQTTKDIVEVYLYGEGKKPSDLMDDSIIRDPLAESTLSPVNVNTYMEGPGRFALGCMSSLVDQFFRPQVYGLNGILLPSLAPGRYTKTQLASMYGNNDYGINFQQYAYQDDIDDLAERTLIWGSTAIKLADDVVFVVEASGTRYIENYALVPRFDDNFDFLSDDVFAKATAEYLQDNMDISRIGRKVVIPFDGEVAARIYTSADFHEDQLTVASNYKGPGNIANALPGVVEILDQLWDEKITQTFDDDHRPILYGQHRRDGAHPEDDNLAPDQLLKNRYITQSDIDGGVRIIAGNGDDQITGGKGKDYFDGGDGDDTLNDDKNDNKHDILDGGDGLDIYKVNSLLQFDDSNSKTYFEQATEEGSSLDEIKDSDSNGVITLYFDKGTYANRFYGDQITLDGSWEPYAYGASYEGGQSYVMQLATGQNLYGVLGADGTFIIKNENRSHDNYAFVRIENFDPSTGFSNVNRAAPDSRSVSDIKNNDGMSSNFGRFGSDQISGPAFDDILRV